MTNIKMIVLGLPPNPAYTNTFDLVLKEEEGERIIAITIGAAEAQAIILELEKQTPKRPLTHDVIRELLNEVELELTEIVIYDYKDGTYFSNLVFEDDDIEIDCRPSDAVAIALRCDAPIYVADFILDEAGKISQITKLPGGRVEIRANMTEKNRLEIIESQLERAIATEDYELAAKLRDEKKKLLEEEEN